MLKSSRGNAPGHMADLTPDKTGKPHAIATIAMVGNHSPRHCGIATFTTDLCNAIDSVRPDARTFVLAMNDVGMKHAYPSRVRFEIAEGDIEAYRRAADFLNVNVVDVVSLQHEYGIFGGKSGGHVLELLRTLRMPIVTTLHTILKDPDKSQRAVMDALIGASERLVVMSEDGANLLAAVHAVDPAKIDVIPHGIPSVPERRSKDTLGVVGHQVILTFGLLSPDKGIEYVIDAMPAILENHPNTVYIVLGATHPHVKQKHGEAYRHMLQTRAERLGVESHVVFHNRFVSQAELVEFLGAADIYATPYLKEEQSTSGTLAYAIGCGKAVISTPYRYARELLAEDRGILVPWRDSAGIAREVVALLDDPIRRAAIQRRAAAFGKTMAWPIVAKRYLESFALAKTSHAARPRRATDDIRLHIRRPELPDIDLSHVRLMTDDTGMLQHSTFDIPNYADGYCIDDNARALLLMTHIEEAGTEAPGSVRCLATRYLAFMNYAFDSASGRFHNFLSYNRTWQDGTASDDSQGRALWALGSVIARTADRGRLGLSTRLFDSVLSHPPGLDSPRAWAYTLLGLDEYLIVFPADARALTMRADLASRLLVRYAHSERPGWPWFEDRLTYCNARLPQALMLTAARTGDGAMADIGERSLAWLAAEQRTPEGAFAPVGTNGFYVRDGLKAEFDQQPVEACSLVSACLSAYSITHNPQWMGHARRAFDWFLGKNPQQSQVYDARTGGCRDGIHNDRMNENQGAESTLSFLTALAEMRAADRIATKLVPVAPVSIATARAQAAAPATLAHSAPVRAAATLVFKGTQE